MSVQDITGGSTTTANGWPTLQVADWQDTLHMWLHVVGKIRMAHAPLVKHWWQLPL